jgi:hypothetical protein
MGLAGNGQLLVGNTTPESQRVGLRLTTISPAGCSLTIAGPDGVQLVKDVLVGDRPGVLEVPAFLLPSGAYSLSFQVKPRSFSAPAELYVNAVEIRRAAAAASSN